MSDLIMKKLKEIEGEFKFFHQLLESSGISPSEEYKRINLTYFRMYCTHYESFCILLQNAHFSSGMLIVRSMLEIFVKSHYLEFIAKGKGDSVNYYLEGKIKYPSFFKMTEELDDFMKKNDEGSGGHFSQYTKNELASYEKFSYFSHGHGEFVKCFYEHGEIGYSTEQISDVIETTRGMFKALSMLLCGVQEKHNELALVIKRFG